MTSTPLSSTSRAIVLHPALKFDRNHSDHQARLDEAVGLALAIDLIIAAADVIPLAAITPRTYIGSGKVEELKTLVEVQEAGLVIMDCTISPVQQRNLEKAWNCKVIDRTALILEIFGQRARTGEGKLQVDLAALEYQKSRLVRSWTHLERQRGGFGFMGGPGETQIESDRRVIGEQITKIKLELETVKRTRQLHRHARKTVPYPIVALVGYTNAGKSTLFNKLTGAQVMAEDKLFATLDPTMRQVVLPSKRKVILSDTVGFISDLPTELIAAFRATLEEVTEADLLLHIRDSSHPATAQQKKDVLQVLINLGLEKDLETKMIEVLNKTDLLADGYHGKTSPHHVAISALSGDNIPALLEMIDEMLGADDQHVIVTLEAHDGKLLSWIYQHAEVLERRETDDHITIAIHIADKEHAQLIHHAAESGAKIKKRHE